MTLLFLYIYIYYFYIQHQFWECVVLLVFRMSCYSSLLPHTSSMYDFWVSFHFCILFFEAGNLARASSYAYVHSYSECVLKKLFTITSSEGNYYRWHITPRNPVNSLFSFVNGLLQTNTTINSTSMNLGCHMAFPQPLLKIPLVWKELKWLQRVRNLFTLLFWGSALNVAERAQRILIVFPLSQVIFFFELQLLCIRTEW